ncbi:uncharacterized protein LOC108112377 isoform X3 [Drosophila eugracilis]|uniref:uncharacterized protein LOC108112377 isoform X3 n=1 Tax=Drosophila eugracilis TaxID=29029 RepID=UPI0007E81776|nr:uncharacterized protein LOC108112377 isoform X3 [Drosophila eugracilis]
MISRCSTLSVLLGVLMIYDCGAGLFKRKWDYEPISIKTYTSDASRFYSDLRIDRVGRGEFEWSGDTLWNYDTSEETMVEASAYRSPTGEESGYKLLPFSIPRQTLYDYLNTYYKYAIVKNFGSCSNIPQFKGKFEPPIPRKTYIGRNCAIDGEGLPEVLPSGFYKVIFNCSGPDQPTWSFVAILKITPNMF